MTTTDYVSAVDGDKLVKAEAMNAAFQAYHQNYLDNAPSLDKVAANVRPNLEPFFTKYKNDDYWNNSEGEASDFNGLTTYDIFTIPDVGVYSDEWAVFLGDNIEDIVLHPRPVTYLNDFYGYTLLVEIVDTENIDDCVISIPGERNESGQLFFESRHDNEVNFTDFVDGVLRIPLVSRSTTNDCLINLTITGLASNTSFKIRLSLYESTPFFNEEEDTYAYDIYEGPFVPYRNYAFQNSNVKIDTMTSAEVKELAENINSLRIVSFYANGGTGTMKNEIVHIGDVYSVPNCDFVKEAYKFDKWKISSKDSADTDVSEEIEIENDLCLKAVWTKIQYIVDIFPNNNTEDDIIHVLINIKNNNYIFPENSFSVPENKVFSGYNTKKDGTGTSYSIGDSLTLSEDSIFYAIWTEVTNE